jgi:hypothetical protein
LAPIAEAQAAQAAQAALAALAAQAPPVKQPESDQAGNKAGRMECR